MFTVKNYPASLIKKIFRYDKHCLPEEISQDIVDGLNYAIATLSPREYFVILEKYKNKRRTATIAGIMGISESRVNQLVSRACSKLSYARRGNFIKYGIAGFVDYCEENAYKKGFNKGYEEGYGMAKVCAKIENAQVIHYKPTIENLELSNLAYAALCRAGIKTIEECVKCEEPNKIDRLGTDCAHEIAMALKRRGISGTEWDHYLTLEDEEYE